MFIPLFNLYWLFYLIFGIPSLLRKIEKKYFPESMGFYFHPVIVGLFYLTLILYNIIPSLILNTHRSTGESIVNFIDSYVIASVFWLTLQAKWNAMIDYSKKQVKNV